VGLILLPVALAQVAGHAAGKAMAAALPTQVTPPAAPPVFPERPRLLTAAEVAAQLGVSKRHVHNLRTRGLLQAVPGLGSSVRFRPEDVRAIVEGKVIPMIGRGRG